MKIRNGFVSNSSSSSFIIIGNELDIRDVTSKMINEKEIIAMGGDVYEGEDVFQITTIEELAFLKALSNLGYDAAFTIVDSLVFQQENCSGSIDVEKLPKTGRVNYYTGSVDYSASDSVETLKERYDKDGKVSKVMERYLRAIKIKKLEGK
jgi:hypothetical protein